MTHLLILLIFSALFIQGWDYATQYDPEWKPQIDLENKNPFGDYYRNPEILGFVRFYFGNFLFYCNLMWFAKPLFLCRICMASFYGSIIFWTYFFCFAPLMQMPVLIWIGFCFALAGLNRIIMRLF